MEPVEHTEQEPVEQTEQEPAPEKQKTTVVCSECSFQFETHYPEEMICRRCEYPMCGICLCDCCPKDVFFTEEHESAPFVPPEGAIMETFEDSDDDFLTEEDVVVANVDDDNSDDDFLTW